MNTILSWTLWLAFALSVISVFINAVSLVLVPDDPSGRQGYAFLLSLGACIIIGSAGAVVGALA